LSGRNSQIGRRSSPLAGRVSANHLRLHRAGAGEVDVDVGVSVFRQGGPHPNLLLPAVHARNRIGVHGEGDVLVHASVTPPDPLGGRSVRWTQPGEDAGQRSSQETRHLHPASERTRLVIAAAAVSRDRPSQP
jgi:hypothetical protein